jgi:hypothetical protein
VDVPDGVDPAAFDPDAHERHQVGPELLPAGPAEPAAGQRGWQARPEQRFRDEDQPRAGHHRLVEQERRERGRAAGDPRVRPLRIRVGAQRVRAEPRPQRHHLGRGEQLARGGPAQVQPVPVTGEPETHLPDGLRRLPRAVGELPVQPQVHVQGQLARVVVQQVLPVRLRGGEDAAGQPGGTLGEAALRAGGVHLVPGEQLRVAGRQAVDGVSLWHDGNGSPAWGPLPPPVSTAGA